MRQISHIFKLVRGQDWWNYKIPPLLAIAYTSSLLYPSSAIQTIATLLLLIISMFFVAAYGHVVNDIFDIEIDTKAGKENLMASFARWQRFLICFFLVVSGITPWFLINWTWIPLISLGLIYILLTIYSAPPIRLKDKGLWGIIGDALQVHAVPTFLVFTLFLGLSRSLESSDILLASIATLWSFLVGVRGILLHQIWDKDIDIQSGLTTLLSRVDSHQVRAWINRIIFPVELLIFGILVFSISLSFPVLIAFTLLYIGLNIVKVKYAWNKSFNPSPERGEYIVPHDFYEVWFPLILVALLTVENPIYIILVILQISLFYSSTKARLFEFSGIFSAFKHDRTQLEHIRQQFDQTQMNLSKTQEELDVSQYSLSQAQLELNDTQTQLQHMQVSVEESKVQIQQKNQELEESQLQLHEGQEQMRQKQTELERSQGKLAQSQDELDKVRTALQQTRMELNQTQTRLQHVQMEFQESKAQIHQKDQELEHAEAQWQQTQVELEQSRKSFEQSQTILQRTQDQLQKTQQELETLNLKLYRDRLAKMIQGRIEAH